MIVGSMGKKLAIRGHSTRGKEVIEILEMMGGHATIIKEISNETDKVFFISDNENCFYRKSIRFIPDSSKEIEEFNVFTLEEFLEKFPFKVGDKVYIKVDPNENCLGYDKIYGVIESAMWFEKFGHVVYKLKDYSRIFYRDELHPYKEEVSMEDNKLFGTVNNPVETKSYTVSLKDGKVIDNSIDASQFMQIGKIAAVCFNTENYENEVELKLGDYEIVVRDGKTYAVFKKPKYPTTYAECCEVLVGRKPKPNEISFDKMELCLVDLDNTQSIDFQNPYLPQLNSLFRLRMCRDAYWKIAGEEMGLGKPWEPAIQDTIWGITRSKGEVEKYNCHYGKTNLLEFPTEEMRDIFYKNFKDLIKECEELL